MSEGSRRCYHRIWAWGVKTGCLCLALLHSVAFVEGERDSPQRARRGWIPASAGMTMALRRPHMGMKTGSRPGTGNHKGCPYGRGTGREDGFLPRVGARGRPYAGMTGGLAEGAEGMETGWRRERATTRVAPTGGGRGGRMDSCLRRNDGWPCEGHIWG